jgi:hypothetical protein
MVRGGLRGEFSLRVPDAADRPPGFLVEVRNFAVAGIEPVEPAATTGPS